MIKLLSDKKDTSGLCYLLPTVGKVAFLACFHIIFLLMNIGLILLVLGYFDVHLRIGYLPSIYSKSTLMVKYVGIEQVVAGVVGDVFRNGFGHLVLTIK